MAVFVDVRVDFQGIAAPWVLRNADHRPTCVHVRDNPVAVEGVVSQHRIEADPVDQVRHTDRVKAVPRKQNETDQVAQSVCQRQNLGGPAAL